MLAEGHTWSRLQYWLSFILPAHGGHQFTRQMPRDGDEVEVEDADADAAEKFKSDVYNADADAAEKFKSDVDSQVEWSQALDGEVYSVSWSADGTKIACGDKAKSVTVLDAASGEVAWSKPLGGAVRSVSWSTDGTKIACGD